MNKLRNRDSVKVSIFLLARLLLSLSLVLTVALPINAQETSKDIYDRMVAIDEKNTSAHVNAIKSGNVGDAILGLWDSADEHSKLTKQLKSIAQNGNAAAAFYLGVYNYNKWVNFFSAMQSAKTQNDISVRKKLADEAFAEALTSFRISSKAGDGDSSYNIAQMYQNGFGVPQTKLAAAEWYANAGSQYLRQGLREVSLAALERAEAIDPKIPEVVALRAQLFPQIKK